jgi:hypothetical protein
MEWGNSSPTSYYMRSAAVYVNIDFQRLISYNHIMYVLMEEYND